MRTLPMPDERGKNLSEPTLIQGLIDGDRALATELLVRIRPLMRHFLSRHHAPLRDWHEEIIGAAELRLFEWRVAKPCRLRADEPLPDLAQRSVRQEAEREVRHRRATREAALAADGTRFADPEDDADAGVHLREVTEVLAALPDSVRAILLTERQHQVGDGRPLEVVLGVAPAAARKRLQRARHAFLQALLARGLADRTKERS